MLAHIGLLVLILQSGAAPLAHSDPPAGMLWIPPGEFLMGNSDPAAPASERPARTVKLDGFWLDIRPVTNAEFAAFVTATGYVTTAERPVVWEELARQVPPGTPRPAPEDLVPGALVFHSTPGPVPYNDPARWWRWTPGASWQKPEGPSSTWKGREPHPVVQVSWFDAVEYARWAGKRLPTEAEWEYAARAGKPATRYAWGEEMRPEGRHMTNTWTGDFPHRNDRADGFERTSPVGAYPPNAWGLSDMGGNVWNWCSDWFRPDAYALQEKEFGTQVCCNPPGPPVIVDPSTPAAGEKVIKGGSFLCNPDYCESYRPPARRGTTPDTGSSHVGFRCARSARPEDGPKPVRK